MPEIPEPPLVMPRITELLKFLTHCCTRRLVVVSMLLYSGCTLLIWITGPFVWLSVALWLFGCGILAEQMFYYHGRISRHDPEPRNRWLALGVAALQKLMWFCHSQRQKQTETW